MQYDVNDDGRLDWLEMRRLCGGLGLDLTEEEAKAAIANIDQVGVWVQDTAVAASCMDTGEWKG